MKMVDIDLVSILDQEARKRIKLYPHRSGVEGVT